MKYIKILIVMLLLPIVLFGKEFYSVRYISIKNVNNESELLKKIPNELKVKTFFINSGRYKVASYGVFKTRQEAEQAQKKLISFGYKKTYIRKKKIGLIPKKTNQMQNNSFSMSETIAKINKLYSKGYFLDCIKEYKNILSNGYSNKNIFLNLSYLYGKFGYTKKLQKMLTPELKESMLFSFERGWYTTLNERGTNFVKTNLNIDKTGKMNLLFGLYIEKTKGFKEAIRYYNKAFLLNPTMKDSIYVKARVFDFENKMKRAIMLYKRSLLLYKSSNLNYYGNYTRLKELERDFKEK